MKSEWIDPDRAPTPEQLAAYADGELPEADRATVAAWLEQDPSGAAEVESLRRLTQLYREAIPPLPDGAAWGAVFGRIETGLRAPAAAVLAPRKSWRLRFGLGAVAAALSLGAAAALLFAVLSLGKGDGLVAVPDEEPYPVVAAEDVVILSIGGDATACLVGAQPPVESVAERDLVGDEDVRLVHFEPHADGSYADVLFQDGAPTMITPPVGWEREP